MLHQRCKGQLCGDHNWLFLGYFDPRNAAFEDNLITNFIHHPSLPPKSRLSPFSVLTSFPCRNLFHLLYTIPKMEKPSIIVVISSSDDDIPKQPRPLKRRRLTRTLPPRPPRSPSSSSDLEIVSHVMRNSAGRDLSQAAQAAKTPPPPKTPAPADPEIAEVGSRTMLQALVDYPHFRFQCAIEPFKRMRAWRKEKFCKRCFCYVCDTPASECTRWKTHSKAVDSAHKWRTERESNLEARRARNAAQPAARRTLPARHVRPAPIRQPIPDDLSLGSSVEEVPIGHAPARGTDDERVEQHTPFEDAERALAVYELEPNLFAMRQIVCALDDTAAEVRPVPIGATLRARNRRAVSRQSGAG